MVRSGDSQRQYVLATGAAAADRLTLLNEIISPGTEEVLRAAGLTQGMHVAEIGCGTGLSALWMASFVGSSGSVTAVDVSAEQLQIAEKNARAAGVTNIRLREATAYETGLSQESFDLVFSRFLMCHLTDPLKALLEMRRILKTSGILVCEDHDDGGVFTEPSTNAYKRLVEISGAVNRANGLDSYIGLKLPRMMCEAGFQMPEVSVKQLACVRGPAKLFWEITLQEAKPAILATRSTTPDELESLCSEMRAIALDESIMLMLARVTQVWARR